MTVASEISRLQTDKECIRQAIIGKGVNVASNLTFDSYAACINAIEALKQGTIDLLVVGGGAMGGGSNYSNGGGGGAGGYIETTYKVKELVSSYCVVVGNCGNYNSGGNSCFGTDIIAYGGGFGGSRSLPKSGGSGGGGDSYCKGYGCGCSGQGNNGGAGCSYGGGGGGAKTAGGAGTTTKGGNGGCGKCSSISGTCTRYAAGGGGGGSGCGGCGGGGAGASSGTGGNASTCGSGGGGAAGGSADGGKGCRGIVILRYKTDGSSGLSPNSTGGCKYTCGQYTIHCFTSSGTFTPVYK